MIKIIKSDIITSAVTPQQYPPAELPEIALAGRSNVGKSSLINTLINRRNLARTSSQPGKTQTINFYGINDAWNFVDLPGYGYAKVSKTSREQWRIMIERYLSERPTLKQIWQLVDLRHPPTTADIQMYEWLCHYDFPRVVIATKADKISKGQRGKHAKVIRQELGLKENELVIFSAQTGDGKEELLSRVEAILNNEYEEA